MAANCFWTMKSKCWKQVPRFFGHNGSQSPHQTTNWRFFFPTFKSENLQVTDFSYYFNIIYFILNTYCHFCDDFIPRNRLFIVYQLINSKFITKFIHTGNKSLSSTHPSANMLGWVVNLKKPASVAQLDAPSDWRPGGHGFNPCRGRQHFFVEIDREIFSTVILSLPLIQEGQLSVSGKRMCTILVNRLED